MTMFMLIELKVHLAMKPTLDHGLKQIRGNDGKFRFKKIFNLVK